MNIWSVTRCAQYIHVTCLSIEYLWTLCNMIILITWDTSYPDTAIPAPLQLITITLSSIIAIVAIWCQILNRIEGGIQSHTLCRSSFEDKNMWGRWIYLYLFPWYIPKEWNLQPGMQAALEREGAPCVYYTLRFRESLLFSEKTSSTWDVGVCPLPYASSPNIVWSTNVSCGGNAVDRIQYMLPATENWAMKVWECESWSRNWGTKTTVVLTPKIHDILNM